MGKEVCETCDGIAGDPEDYMYCDNPESEYCYGGEIINPHRQSCEFWIDEEEETIEPDPNQAELFGEKP